jgi:hypothetical protein
MLTRRDFNLGLTSAAFGGLALSGCSDIRDKVARWPGLRQESVPKHVSWNLALQRTASHPMLELMPGLECEAISFRGEPGSPPNRMRDGFDVPDKADGMGAFRLDDDRVVLVRNHELKASNARRGPFGGDRGRGVIAYDYDRNGQALPGGTTRIVYNCATGSVESESLTLAGTVRNCAGGVTPWGTWLTCEEPDKFADPERVGASRRHGYVFEVPAMQEGLAEPICHKGLGRFNHEAAAVDPRTGIVYLTEDRIDGLFYRFLPDRPGDLRAGRLQALVVADGRRLDTRNWTADRWEPGCPLPVSWRDLGDADPATDDLRRRGHEDLGAIRFACGEGIHFGTDELYFCCTSGGTIRSGQIMRYRRSPYEGQGGSAEERTPASLELFLEVRNPRVLNYCDNLTVAPNGHLIVCEDTYVGAEGGVYVPRIIAEPLGGAPVCCLRGVTPEGEVYDIARLRGPTELAGVCFSPKGDVLFVNSYSPATTFAIRGLPQAVPGWSVAPDWKVYNADGRDWRGPSPPPHPSRPPAQGQCPA